MANYAATLEEEMIKRGEAGSYIWMPNRLFARRGDRYEPADSVSDGSAYEVAEAVAEKGQEKIDEINALAAAQKALIAANEADYDAVRTSLLQTYQRMYNYFMYQELYELSAVMEDAINGLKEEPNA